MQPNIERMDYVILDGQPLSLAEIEAVSLAARKVALAPAALARISESRGLIEQILAAGQTVYGVNTGFGKLLSEGESRAMLLLRANVLAKGFSGCRSELVELLIGLLNAGVHPVIPEKGSVGASGDPFSGITGC